MINKLVVIINNKKKQKIKKILLYEMKFLVPNYSCLQNPWLGCYRPRIPVLSVLCPQINLLNPPPEQNSWVGHWATLEPLNLWSCNHECHIIIIIFIRHSLRLDTSISVPSNSLYKCLPSHLRPFDLQFGPILATLLLFVLFYLFLSILFVSS
jgi:hypothetical protein